MKGEVKEGEEMRREINGIRKRRSRRKRRKGKVGNRENEKERVGEGVMQISLLVAG